MNDSNTASVRTSWTMGVIAFLAWLASFIFGVEIGTDNPWIILVAPVVVGIFHRTFLVFSEVIPYFGYIVFGVNRSPNYTLPPPHVPALADEGLSLIETILVIVCVVLALVGLWYLFG